VGALEVGTNGVQQGVAPMMAALDVHEKYGLEGLA
jgi:hypothetical protein